MSQYYLRLCILSYLASRRQKEMLKEMETPEEKRARRLAKKAAKEEKKRMAMGWDKEHLAYSNTVC